MAVVGMLPRVMVVVSNLLIEISNVNEPVRFCSTVELIDLLEYRFPVSHLVQVWLHS